MKLKMDFISSVKLNGKPENKKIDYILEKVKDGSILVLDGVMKPEEAYCQQADGLDRLGHLVYHPGEHSLVDVPTGLYGIDHHSHAWLG